MNIEDFDLEAFWHRFLAETEGSYFTTTQWWNHCLHEDSVGELTTEILGVYKALGLIEREGKPHQWIIKERM